MSDSHTSKLPRYAPNSKDKPKANVAPPRNPASLASPPKQQPSHSATESKDEMQSPSSQGTSQVDGGATATRSLTVVNGVDKLILDDNPVILTTDDIPHDVADATVIRNAKVLKMKGGLLGLGNSRGLAQLMQMNSSLKRTPGDGRASPPEGQVDDVDLR